MDVEIGLFWVDQEKLIAFEPVVEDIRNVFREQGVEGARSFHIGNSIEDPARWAVIAVWDSIDHHRRFQDSAEGRRQRAMLDRFMKPDPEVIHFRFPEIEDGLR